MTTMSLPDLFTPRLDLRQRSAADLPALLEMGADPEVMQFIGDGRTREPETHRGELSEQNDKEFGEGLGYWSVYSKGGRDRFMGWVYLAPLPGYCDIELGYRFKREFWGKGYAAEACHACVEYAFGELGLPEVVAVAHPENTRSHKVLSKLGFTASGLRHAYGGTLPFYRRSSDRRRS